MTPGVSAGPLNAEQVAFFTREGYLVVEELFTNADLQPVIEAITVEVDRRARELVAVGELSQTYDDDPFETRLARISSETGKVASAIWNGNLALAEFFELITHPRLLDIAEQFCGPEIVASSVYRLRPKVPYHSMGPVPWHQDSGYFEPFCDNSLVLTVWLPLVDATPERGCLWVLPRTHGGEVYRHRVAQGHPYLEIAPEHLPAGQPVCVPVKKGGVLLLSNRTPHVSFENTTDIVRWSMDLRYQNAALPTNAEMSRLEGDAASSADDGIPAACYPPEADFLVRSHRRPQEVVTSAAAFRKLRESHVYQPVTARW